MATTKTADKNVFEFWADAQKDLINTWKDSAENTKGSFWTNEAFDKSGEYFQNWYNKQTELFNSAKTAATTDANPAEWLNNWYKEQMDLSKSWTAQYNTLMNNPNFNWANPTESMTDAKENMEKVSEFYNNWSKQATEMYKNWSSKLENPFQKDAFTNMFDKADVFMNASQFWMPIFKSFQNNKFDMDTFKSQFNMDSFKGMMDKMFNFAPTEMKDQYTAWTKNFTEMFDGKNPMFNMGQFNNPFANMMPNGANMFNGTNPFANMMPNGANMFNGTNPFANMMPNGANMFNGTNPFANMMPNGSDMFNNGLNSYNDFMNKFNEMNSPFMKMMTPGADKNKIEEMQAITNEFVKYNTTSSQMQYLVYANGLKTMESFAEFLKAKADKKETYENFTGFYTDYLNHMDAAFVELFRSKEYSKVQADFSSASHKLKSMMQTQTEKALTNIPVATRTEMTELYKTVHEMNKRIKTLEAELATAKKTTTAKTTTAKTAAKATTTAKATTAKSTTAKTSTKTATAKK